MPLETATHISGLVASNPASSDGLNQADDHLRLIKQVLLNDIGSALTSQALTVVDGSAAAPSIGFAADASAGFYRKGASQTAVVGSLVGKGPVPIGSLIDFAGPDVNVPLGYLPCDGEAVSRTAYPDLFAAIGTTWGAGDGSTTFNVPNLIDRFRRHRGNGGFSGFVGNLQGPQNLSHTHTGSGNTGTESADHAHTFSGTTGSMNRSNPHSHPYTGYDGGSVNAGGGFGGAYGGARSTDAVDINHEHAFSGTTSGRTAAHTHAFSFTTSAGSADGAETRPLSATVLTCIRAQ